MVKNFEGGSALIGQWLKNKGTVLFLGVWEKINNSFFNFLEFERIKNEAGRNSFFLSAKKWSDLTGAIGLQAKAGSYGGTYAHKNILLLSSAHGSALNSSFIQLNNFKGLKMKKPKQCHWNGISNVLWQRSTTAYIQMPLKNT